ncbi:MAG: glycosyltransferase [Bacteriovoracaceae bacterium]|nr:glycosyltransferase [Bacteriovoracaceae bacterium]
MTNNQILILIPIYYEKENLPAMLNALSNLNIQLDILIIDDTPDKTSTLNCLDLLKKDNIYYIHRKNKDKGLGLSYIDAYQWAQQKKYKKLIQMDCDFSHDPKELNKIINKLDQYDCVIGSRFASKSSTANWPKYRLLISKIAYIYIKVLLGLKIKDPTGGFIGSTNEVIQNIDFYKFISKGYSFQIEMKYHIIKQGFKVKEIPITFHQRTEGYSKFNISIILEAFINVLKIKRNT